MKDILLLSLFTISFCGYNRQAAVAYAHRHVRNPNHACGNYASCTPWSYWGSEYCGYPSHGGDCANFVSQCLLAGGHPALKRPGDQSCRGYPCGKEEIGAWELTECLPKFGWSKQCGRRMATPSNTKPGDVIVYFDTGCPGQNGHAVIITSVVGGRAKITCHSSIKEDVDYDYQANSKPFYTFLHYND